MSRNGNPSRELTDSVLPSSLTRFLPITLVRLHLPTCVGLRYGRLDRKWYDAFPGNFIVCRGLVLRPHSPAVFRCCFARRSRLPDLPRSPNYIHCAGKVISPGRVRCFVTPYQLSNRRRNFSLLSIDYAFRPRLRPG